MNRDTSKAAPTPLKAMIAALLKKGPESPLPTSAEVDKMSMTAPAAGESRYMPALEQPILSKPADASAPVLMFLLPSALRTTEPVASQKQMR
jgi:hypothetical protein